MTFRKKRDDNRVKEEDYANTVVLKDVTKKYQLDGGNACLAVKNVSLTVKKGEFVAVCGNGARGALYPYGVLIFFFYYDNMILR